MIQPRKNVTWFTWRKDSEIDLETPREQHCG